MQYENECNYTIRPKNSYCPPQISDEYIYYDTIEYTTSFYYYTQFEQPVEPADFTGTIWDYGTDTNGNGLYDYLTLDIEINVRDAGYYSLSGSLYVTEEENDYYVISYAVIYPYLDVGIQIVQLNFYGSDIHASGKNGPYNVHLELIPYIDPIDPSMDYVTNYYEYTQFEPPYILLE